jgi:hypothetical protein
LILIGTVQLAFEAVSSIFFQNDASDDMRSLPSCTLQPAAAVAQQHIETSPSLFIARARRRKIRKGNDDGPSSALIKRLNLRTVFQQ